MGRWPECYTFMIFGGLASPEREDGIRAAVRGVRLLVMDADGVLTSGALAYNTLGGEWVLFSVKDGLGLRLAARAGLGLAIVSGRRSEAVLRRAGELGIAEIRMGVRDKRACIEEMARERGLACSEIAFVGDDLPDLSAMAAAGLAVAVADAHPAVRQSAHLVTEARGGEGAVREAIEYILEAQGKWEALLRSFKPA